MKSLITFYNKKKPMVILEIWNDQWVFLTLTAAQVFDGLADNLFSNIAFLQLIFLFQHFCNPTMDMKILLLN
jgi:hypothetical protein